MQAISTYKKIQCGMGDPSGSRGATKRNSIYPESHSFQSDMDRSLTSTMTLIGNFGFLLGFAMNWDKSILFPLDEPSTFLPQISQKIMIVTS